MFRCCNDKTKLPLYASVAILSMAIQFLIVCIASSCFSRDGSLGVSRETVVDVYKKGGEVYCLFDGEWSTFSGIGWVVSKADGWIYDEDLNIFYRRYANGTVVVFARNLCFKQKE